MTQPYRMQNPQPPEFSAPVIDREAPIAFRLDGRRFTGFSGDTVLSALLASGVDTLGLHRGHPHALDDASAPPVALKGNADRDDLAMPMALCPVTDGADLVTCAPKRMRRRALGGLLGGSGKPGASLDLDLGHGLPPAMPWITGAPEILQTVDVAIVGGGLAGMAAALAAAELGMRVALIERGPRLGGMAEYFGKVEGEATPREMIDHHASTLPAHRAVTLYLATHAFDIADGSVRAIRVALDNGIVRPQRIAVVAPHIVLATGEEERLPIFPGNRLPGVVPSAFAWRMAALYGVWRGESAHIHTTTNAGYRLALLGADCGKTIVRADDPRSDPRTRFIAFSKAYGFPLARGVRIDAVVRDAGMLAIRHADASTGQVNPGPTGAASLIVSGGWQPDLALWLRAGGAAVWDAQSQCLVPKGKLSDIVFAGSAAGYASQTGCVQSGQAAVDALLSGTIRTVSDPRIDADFESPDGPLTVAAPSTPAQPPAYLAPGPALNALPTPRVSGLTTLFARARPAPRAIGDRALSVREAAGAIGAGRVPAEAATAFCHERVILPRGLFASASRPQDTGKPHGLPPYLNARFGARQALWTLSPETGRHLGPGCLIFIDSDTTDPEKAIGVVVTDRESKEVRALIAPGRLRAGETAFIRDGLASVPATLIQRIAPGPRQA